MAQTHNYHGATLEIFQAIQNICETLDDTHRTAFCGPIDEIVRRYLNQTVVSSDSSAKTGTKRATKPKDKAPRLSHKNAYHFFVSANMPTVTQGSKPRERMGVLAGKWKAISEAEKVPYTEMANRYNSFIDEALKNGDWESNVDQIKQAANAEAFSGTGLNSEDVNTDTVVEDAVETVVSQAPAVVTKVAAAPVVAAPVAVPVGGAKTTRAPRR